MKTKVWLLNLFVLSLVLTACTPESTMGTSAVSSLDDVPPYSGSPYVAVNNNVPYFEESDLTTSAYETYSDLDYLGRCGVAEACVGVEIMPTEDRGSISNVKPSGWQTAKYDCVDGKYLYNRCHLIGFQLTGENANKENLITGTRYLNVDGMLPFENMVADYVKETENHVLYRVTPVFHGDDLVATGVLLEAMSVEDQGEELCFNVYCYNVQPGVTIDYTTGDSALEGSQSAQSSLGYDYVVNTNSKKFHKPDCSSVKQITDADCLMLSGSRQDMLNQGYNPCGRCKP